MATAHDVVAAIHTEVENFKGELIQLCPESSAEKHCSLDYCHMWLPQWTGSSKLAILAG